MDSEPQPQREVPEEFWQLAEERLLILDYDGTLAPFKVQRDEAWPYPGVREELQHMQALGNTRIVIVTGRTVEDLQRLLPLSPPPEIWGSHGHVRLRHGKLHRTELSEAVKQALQDAEQAGLRIGAANDLEVKPACVAFHWRGKPENEAKRLETELRSAWSPLISAGLSIHSFDGGLELRSDAMNKGSAINQLLAELGNTYIAAYLGDDLTDEDAFAALAGKGLAVLVRPELRKTMARVWLKPPEELLGFLRKWRQVCMGATTRPLPGGSAASH